MAGTSSKGIVSIGLFVKQRFSRPLNSLKSKPSQSNLQISFPSKFNAAFFVSFWSAETGTEWNLLFAKLNSFVLKKNLIFEINKENILVSLRDEICDCLPLWIVEIIVAEVERGDSSSRISSFSDLNSAFFDREWENRQFSVFAVNLEKH